MAILNTLSNFSNKVQIGGSALSLIGLGKALLSPDNPPKGISGFVMDIIETDSVQHSAQVTDHFTEDNYAIQDHVAFDPVRITLVGRVGELVYTKAAALDFAQQILDRLQPFGILSPSKDMQARKYIAAANQTISALKAAGNALGSLYNVLNGKPSKNNQTSAFEKFEEFFFGRSLLTVETPWKTYDNMILESWSADQDATTIYETSFTLTFKKLRIVSTTTNVGQLIGRIVDQKSQPVNQGTQQGKSILATGADKLFGK